MKGAKRMVRKYQSGDVIEISSFIVGNATKTRKPRRTGATPPRKQEQNERAAERYLARLINCNFFHGLSSFVTLKYSVNRFERLINGVIRSGQPLTHETIREAAVKERDNFLRRVQYELKKYGAELKYIALTSDRDGDTGENVRIHHHILIPKIALEIAIKHWGIDEIDIRALSDQKDHTPIAVYLLRQVTREKSMHKYKASRNLAHPIITEEIVYVNKEIKPPQGAVVKQRTYDSESGTQYIRYIEPPPRKTRRRATALEYERDSVDGHANDNT